MQKIEEFLFDLFGLFLPGLIACLAILSFMVSVISINDSKELVIDTYNNMLLYKGLEIPGYISMFLGVVGFYMIGHVIKVLSKLFYDICPFVFDRLILKVLNCIILFMKRNVSDVFTYGKDLLNKVIKLINDLFSFNVESYSTDFEEMKFLAQEQLYKNFGYEYFRNNKSWYPFYKIANSICVQAGIRTQAKFFLAKYNFYRSIAFIFMLHLIGVIFCLDSVSITSIILQYKGVIILLDILFIFTFHLKYKRYWVACGNEAIVGLYHALNLIKENEILESIQSPSNIAS